MYFCPLLPQDSDYRSSSRGLLSSVRSIRGVDKLRAFVSVCAYLCMVGVCFHVCTCGGSMWEFMVCVRVFCASVCMRAKIGRVGAKGAMWLLK